MSETTEFINTLSWREAWSRPWIWGLAVFSLGLLVWILWRANLGEVWSSLQSANYGLLALGIPVILVGLIFRAIRWRILLLPLGRPSFHASFGAMLVGYLVNNLLPLRAGELVRVYILGRQVCINKSAILATIVVEKIIDGLIMLLALLSLLMVFPIPAWVRQIVAGGTAVFVGATVVLIAARRSRVYIINLFQALLSRLPKRWQTRGVSLLDNFLVGLRSFRTSTDALIYSLMTIIVWSTDVLLFWLVMHAFGISLGILHVILVVAAGALSTMIPALPGYMGTYQFVLVNTLTFLGVFVGPATAFAIGVHAVAWLTVNIVSAAYAVQLGVALGHPYGRIPTGQDVTRTLLDSASTGNQE